MLPRTALRGIQRVTINRANAHATATATTIRSLSTFRPSRSIGNPISVVHLQARRLSYTPSLQITDPKTGRGKPSTPNGTSSGATKQDAQSQKKDEFDVNQPEFESPASTGKAKDPEVERAATPNELPSEDQPRGPLPDLRHGIPSTFEQEFAPSDKSSSFKDKDTPDPSLNVTEDPTKEDSRSESAEGELPKQAYVSSIERRRNRMANFAYLGALLLLVGGAVSLGGEWESDEEARRHPDALNGWTPAAVYSRISARIGYQLGYYTEPASLKILPEVGLDQRPPYTLVMSLEDLLITSKWSRQNGWEVAKRPGFDYFIRYLTSYYELVVFTTVPAMNGQMVMAKLDPFRLIMWPLFRECTRYMNGEHVKDLSALNRDLSKVIIIDTKSEHVKLQPENAIVLPKWNGQAKDEHTGDLVALIPFLEYIASQPNVDVRKVLKSFEGKNIPAEFSRREAAMRAELEKRSAKQQRGAGGLSNMLGFQGQSPIQMADRTRELGRKQYEDLEKQIRENGARWLEEQKELERQQMEDMTKTVQNNPLAYFSMMFGGMPPPGAEGSSGGDGKK